MSEEHQEKLNVKDWPYLCNQVSLSIAQSFLQNIFFLVFQAFINSKKSSNKEMILKFN